MGSAIPHGQARNYEEQLAAQAVTNKQDIVSHTLYRLDGDDNFYIEAKCAATADFKYKIIIVLDDPLDISWKETRCIRDAVKFCLRGNTFNKSSFESWKEKAEQFGFTTIEKCDDSISFTIRVNRVNSQFNAGFIQKMRIYRDDNEDIRVAFHTDNEKYDVLTTHVVEKDSYSLLQTSCFADVVSIAEPGDKMDDSIFLQYAAQLKSKFNCVSVSGESGDLFMQVIPMHHTPQQCGMDLKCPIALPEVKAGPVCWSEKTKARIEKLKATSCHMGIVCDGCGKTDGDFTGRRYHCEDCSDFDLCCECFEADVETLDHLSSHSMKPIDAPQQSPSKQQGAADLVIELLVQAALDSLSPLQKERLAEERVVANAQLPDGSSVVVKWLYGIDSQNNFKMDIETRQPKLVITLVAILKDHRSISADEARVIQVFLKIAERGTPLKLNHVRQTEQFLKEKFEKVNLAVRGSTIMLVVEAGGARDDIGPGRVKQLRIAMDSDNDLGVAFFTDVEQYAVLINHRGGGGSYSMKQGTALGDVLKICEPGMKMDNSMFLFFCAQLRCKYNLLKTINHGGIMAAYIIPTSLTVSAAGVDMTGESDIPLPAVKEGTTDWSDSTRERVKNLEAEARRGRNGRTGVTCNACQCEISGKYFQCAECIDYFLCSSCFNNGRTSGAHLSSHAIRVVSPLGQGSDETKTADRDRKNPATKKCHLNIVCSGCGVKNFTSRRHKCLECDEFNLCQTCFNEDAEKDNHFSTHDVAFMAPRDPLPAPPALDMPTYAGGNVVATELLKNSGQAKVYRGQMVDGAVKTSVCIKVYHSSDDWQAAQKEIMAIVRIPNNDHVISVLAFYESPLPCLVMPLIEGRDLCDLLEVTGRLPPKHAASVLRGTASGLCHLHSFNVIHRDMKSPNVMVELPSYRAVLIDLGLGKVANHVDLQSTMAAKGTPLWMAPEMVRKKAYSRKTDIYAMGIIIWEVFAGTIPYQDKNIEMYELFQFIVQDKGRPDLSRVRDAPGMSDEMFNLMQDCWHHDPDMRPSADEVVKRLEQA
jgi:hypothetical protein